MKPMPMQAIRRSLFVFMVLFLNFQFPVLLLSGEHDLLAVEHACEAPDAEEHVADVGAEGYEDGRPLQFVGEDGGHHLDAVVEGDEVGQDAGGCGALEHGYESAEHHREHERGDHGAGVLHVLGQSGEDADGGGHDEHGGEDDEEEHEVVVGGVEAAEVDVGLGGHHLGQRENDADEAGDAAEECYAGEGDDLAQRQLVAVHGCDEEGGYGAAFLLAGDGAGGYGHDAGEEEHEDEHGDELGEDVAQHLVVGGLVVDGLLAVFAVDVEAVAHLVLDGGECGVEGCVDAARGLVGAVVVDFHVGCRQSRLWAVGGYQAVEAGGEAHQHLVDVLVGEGVDVGLRDGRLRGHDAGQGVEQGLQAWRHALHAEGHDVVGTVVHHLLHAAAHEAVDDVDEQAGHDDGGEEQLAVAEEAGELFLDDGKGV